MRNSVGSWLVAGVVAGAALFALLSSPRTPPPLGRGSSAPDFALERLGGGASVSLSELRGQVVLINFWATWCKPCEDEMPAMERLYQTLRGEGFELLAISVDEQPEIVAQFRDRLSLSFPILLDEDRSVSQEYQTYRFPESFLVDRDGRVVERYVGPRDWNASAYLSRLRRLLREAGTRAAGVAAAPGRG
ncbi:MAG: TlpA family protein disulfide reductase [Myxococcales bacterium]|nr:TlpA family protein disulfide reductase [Myxococcales bacterium]MDH5567285.1 TlpA family protein disulfide reductase [Myxococcales bacterium]